MTKWVDMQITQDMLLLGTWASYWACWFSLMEDILLYPCTRYQGK